MLNLKPNSATIHAVIVVPMFAPKMTPTDCCSVIKPALTNDTTITVVAPEDWIIIVIKQPVNTAAKRLLVIIAKKRCKLFPALF